MTMTGMFALILIAIGVGGFIFFSKMKVQHKIKEQETSSENIGNSSEEFKELLKSHRTLEKQFDEFRIEYYRDKAKEK